MSTENRESIHSVCSHLSCSSGHHHHPTPRGFLLGVQDLHSFESLGQVSHWLPQLGHPSPEGYVLFFFFFCLKGHQDLLSGRVPHQLASGEKTESGHFHIAATVQSRLGDPSWGQAGSAATGLPVGMALYVLRDSCSGLSLLGLCCLKRGKNKLSRGLIPWEEVTAQFTFSFQL